MHDGTPPSLQCTGAKGAVPHCVPAAAAGADASLSRASASLGCIAANPRCGYGMPTPLLFWEVSPTPLPNSLREVPSAAVHALENRTRLQVPRLLPASYPALVR